MLTSGTGLGFINPAKMKELRNRILFLLGAITIFRVGSYIPVPGVNPEAVRGLFDKTQGTILSLFNTFSGGALGRLSVFALGVIPYISASIIMQLMSMALPSLMQLRKEGESGRRKLNQYTRYMTVLLACIQSFGAVISLRNQGISNIDPVLFILLGTISLVSGTIFLMWLGEQVTERGIGNGISMLIFAGIVAGIPSSVSILLEQVGNGELSLISALAILVISFLMIACVVFMERAQRRIPVHYAKRANLRNTYTNHQIHLPLKLNMSGVIPPMFASSIILFPATLLNWIGQNHHNRIMQQIILAISPGQPLYYFIYASLILFFSYFYTALVFDTRESSDNLKKSGAFIPGIRPGEHTARYLDRIITRLTLIGSLYLIFVCLFPEAIIVSQGLPFHLGGTSVLIVVVVVLEFINQLQSMLMTSQYETLLRKQGREKQRISKGSR
jgi:preprotein translocase subunit SecY